MVNVQVDVSKDMVEFAKSASAREKPYDICLHCGSFAVTCDGPNILAMDYPRWVEWATEHIRRKKLKVAEIALASGLPQSTIKSALSGIHYDTRTDTMRKITKALVGGCWGQYPCHLASLLMEGDVHEVDQASQTMTAGERERMEEHIRQVRADYQAKVDYLKEQVEHWKKETEHWKEESRIRDKYLAEKNARIDSLMDRILRETDK